jgi:DNA-binding transcriptional regulator of glucitol operon
VIDHSRLSYGETVRRFRFALRPGWIVLHLLCLALIVTMVLLGRWQLIVSDEKHFSLQNFGYAIQWWLFSCFVAFMWVRLMRDRLHRDAASASQPAPPPVPVEQPSVAYRRYVMPTLQSESTPSADPALAAYNAYLAELAARDARR